MKGPFPVLLLAVLFLSTVHPVWAQCLQPPPVTPPLDSTVLPLPILGTGLYEGLMGGLYPDGRSSPPSSYRQVQKDATRKIIPSGPDGLIGMITIGFSNQVQEFGAFMHHQNENPDRNARLVFVNTSEGGQSVDSTITVDEDLNSDFWDNVIDKVEAAGLTRNQVRLAWIKTTTKDHEADLLTDATAFKDKMITLMQLLKHHYPKLEIAYVSSRIYSGYASPVATEPNDYEEGFAYRMLIEEQIDGTNPDLDYENGTVPLILWGPYLWANGDWQPYNDLIWCPEDYEEGGTNRHLNELGEEKVAAALEDFFATDRLTRRWWGAQPDLALSTTTALRDTYVADDEAAGCVQTDFGDRAYMATTVNDVTRKYAYVTFDYGSESRPIVRAWLGLRSWPEDLNPEEEKASTIGMTVTLVDEADEDWQENGFTWCTQPDVLDSVAFISAKGHPRGSYLMIDVTDAITHDTNGRLSFRLVADSSRLSTVAATFMTRDDDPDHSIPFPAQLILMVDDTGTLCEGGPCTRRTARVLRPQTEPAVHLTAYPIPFNPTTTVEVVMPATAEARIILYDVLGREQARLYDAPLPAGAHRFTVDGSRLASGVYFLRVTTPQARITRRLVLQK